MNQKYIIAKDKKSFEMKRDINNLLSSVGGEAKPIIREYLVKDLTVEEAEKMWYEDKIICDELMYVRELRGE